MNIRWTPLLALLGLLLTACPSGAVQSKGQLEVTVNIPAGSGLTPNVSVAGPGGFSRTITTEGVTLIDEAATGAYTITGQSVTAGSTTYNATVTIGTTPGGTNSGTATVVANTKATATVAYAAALSGLQVNVTNAPANTRRVVVRAVSSGGSETVDATLTGNGSVNLAVPNGSYSVSVQAFAGTDSTVAETVSSFTQASATAPAVVSANAFTARPATGRLYLAGVGGSPTPSGVAYLTDAQLQAAGSAVPGAQSRSDTEILEVAFDRGGNLYQLKLGTAANTNQTLITRFPAATAELNAPTPVSFVITNGYFQFAAAGCAGGTCRDRNLTSPTDMAVDAAGNLWVVDPASAARIETNGGSIPAATAPGRLVCYSAADQAAATGNIGTPGTIYYGGAIAGASSLAFDRGGNLWLGGTVGGARNLNRIAAASLQCPNLNPTTQNPVTNTLPSDRNFVISSSVGEVADLALDPSGNSLWVANRTGNNIVQVDANAPTLTTGAIVSVTGQTGTLAPTSLAFDARGRLWVGSGVGGGTVFSLPALPATAGAATLAADKSFTAAFPVTSLAFNLGNLNSPMFLR